MSPPKLSVACPGAGCDLEEKVDLMLVELRAISHAFPDGPEAHRASHEAMMKAAVAEERFWNELKLDIAKKGIWGLLIVVLGLAVIGISTKFGLALPR